MKTCPECHLTYHEETERCLVDGAALITISDPLVGKVLAGRYVIEGIVGEGGMATVYRARHALVERPCAVKVLHPALAEDTRLRERLRREARAMAQLAHPNICEVYDFGLTDDQRPFVVMELLEGSPLDALVRRDPPMPPEQVIDLGIQIACGLARAHDFGVIHRDLKPENIFVVEDPHGKPLVKLVDFGIARASEDSHLTATGEIIGTPQFMAPERITSAEPKAAADLYSLGVVLFEMVTGRLPFLSETTAGFLVKHMHDAPPRPRELAPACPERLETLILAMLEKEPERRPVDAHQVVRILSELATAEVPSGDAASAAGAPRAVRTSRLPAPESTATLDRWQGRASLFDEMIKRAYPEGEPPSDLNRALGDLRGTLGRLGALRETGVRLQRELELLEQEAYGQRERLGHAVHVLAVDLSRAREAVRAAEQALAKRGKEAADLVFQVQVLGEQLNRVQTELEQSSEEHQDLLKDNGRQRLELEKRLIELAQRICDPLRERRELSDLFMRLDS